MKPKLVVLDLDGTLLDPDREAPIRPAVVAAVRRTLVAGVGVTLATGRTWEYAHLRARELGIHLPLVTGQGATLAEADSGRLLRETFLPLEAARAGARAQEAVFSLYLREPSGGLKILLNRMERPSEYYLHLLGRQTLVEPDMERFLDDGCQALKFVVFGTDVALWQRRLGPAVHISRTHADLVEATAAGVDKGSGVAHLMEHLGLARQDVMAVGDNENDLPMFERVGLAVAMGQSPPSVLAAAHWIAPSFENDGVAAALEKFVLT